VLDTISFLLSVNVLSNSISADFSFYYCVYSVLSQLSRIAPNNGDSHKCSMYQNVQTCILEVNRTRIGIKPPVDVVYCVRWNTWKYTRIYTWRIYQLWQYRLITPWLIIPSKNLITFTIA